MLRNLKVGVNIIRQLRDTEAFIKQVQDEHNAQLDEELESMEEELEARE
jgi:hypothetical protein